MNNKITNSVYQSLNEKWTKKHQKLQDSLFQKHKSALDWATSSTKQLTVGSLGGLMLLTTPLSIAIPDAHSLTLQNQAQKEIGRSIFLITDLFNVLPDKPRPLSISEEDVIAQTLTRHFGFRVTPELEDKRLNRSYGFIGAEQHLMRFPGDNINTHFDTKEEMEMFSSSGMAPGLGAWGYFSSPSGLAEKDKLREKYYIAVQTFLAPGFNDNIKEFVDFFKYRKMLVVNPNNGKAIVVVIGDAGPAEWTGKQLGGSPEVMRYLERFDGKAKGLVLYFFIDDPEDKIPLGPIRL
ncbi:MAG: hypothetical protein M1308_04890 [Actinobacteria bacterium]|nr:hypothetical protein [Actinomycetota bacterium]